MKASEIEGYCFRCKLFHINIQCKETMTANERRRRAVARISKNIEVYEAVLYDHKNGVVKLSDKDLKMYRKKLEGHKDTVERTNARLKGAA